MAFSFLFWSLGSAQPPVMSAKSLSASLPGCRSLGHGHGHIHLDAHISIPAPDWEAEQDLWLLGQAVVSSRRSTETFPWTVTQP